MRKREVSPKIVVPLFFPRRPRLPETALGHLMWASRVVRGQTEANEETIQLTEEKKKKNFLKKTRSKKTKKVYKGLLNICIAYLPAFNSPFNHRALLNLLLPDSSQDKQMTPLAFKPSAPLCHPVSLN